MVWIIVAAIGVAVIGLGALAWWSSGRSKPLGRREARDLSRAEKDGLYRQPQQQAHWSGGGPTI